GPATGWPYEFARTRPRPARRRRRGDRRRPRRGATRGARLPRCRRIAARHGARGRVARPARGRRDLAPRRRARRPRPHPATAGPLRQGFGAVRDHVLGVTFVTGDGRLVHSGGRVVKNVAGYDLTKLEAGGFGAFGVIVLVHLRLRALPRADQTFVLAGTR